MNILLINHYAGSLRHGMAYRPYYFAREWVRDGHTVRILAASYTHVRSMQPLVEGEPIQHITTEMIDGIEYVWYPTPAYVGNGLSRVRNIWAFLRQVWGQAKKIAHEFKPDVVIASSTYPMDIWVARRIARLAKAKLVFEVHDLWPLSPIELGGMSPSHPFIRICQWAENAAYRDADLVVSMLPSVANYVLAKGLDLARLAIVPNGVSLDEWSSSSGDPLRDDLRNALDAAHATDCAVVGYAGSHGVPNALDTLLDAAARLREEPVRFMLVGDGHERERLAERIQNERLCNVQMFLPIPKTQVPAFLAGVQAAYLGAPKQPIYRFGVSPNKMIDYMMTGVPILYAIEAGNNPVAEADCGMTVPAENANALAEAIITLLKKTPTDRLKCMSENGQQYARTHHTYDVLAAQFISAIRNSTPRKT